MSKYLQTSRHHRKTFVRGRRVARADADQVTSGKVSDSFVSRDRARWLAAENNNRLKCFSPTLSQVYFRRKGKRGRNKRCWATRATRCAAGVAKRQQEVDIVWDAKGDWRHACVSPHWRARGERESGRSKGDLFDPDTYWRHRGVELFKLISNESRTLPSLGNKVFFSSSSVSFLGKHRDFVLFIVRLRQLLSLFSLFFDFSYVYKIYSGGIQQLLASNKIANREKGPLRHSRRRLHGVEKYSYGFKKQGNSFFLFLFHQ